MPVKRINFTLTPEVKDQLTAAADSFEALLSFSLNLSPYEKKRSHGLGDQNYAFTKNVAQYLEFNENIKPGHLDVTSFRNNIDVSDYLMLLSKRIQKIAEKVMDTAKIAASDAYRDARHFYRGLQTAIESEIPGTKKIYEGLAKHFDRKSGSSGATDDTGDNTANQPEPLESLSAARS
jgi:hypothetical protein